MSRSTMWRGWMILRLLIRSAGFWVTRQTQTKSSLPASVLPSKPAPDSSRSLPGYETAHWDPFPFHQFILKVASRCNLKCDYCYMYEMADDSWRKQPRIMSMETISVTARRIADHVEEHQLSDIQIILHGGEPLLTGTDYIDAAAAELRDVIGANVDLRVQTNGTLISDPMLEVLARHDIRVGVSLD